MRTLVIGQSYEGPWYAYYAGTLDGEGSVIGWGDTPSEAKQNLQEQWEAKYAAEAQV